MMCACDNVKLKDTNGISYRRVRTVESINKLRSELFKHNWEKLYEETDTDKAYETFLMIFKSLYNKQCPLKQFKNKNKINEKPWITNGLQNACKKKKRIPCIKNL